LPVQKVTQEEEADFAVNFFEEPRQSRLQLKTIVQLVAEHVSSRREYLKALNSEADIIMDAAETDDDSQLPAELAKIIVGVFGQFTSVVFDVEAIVEQF
jgi:uncharacterized phosphosugar-binding protein